MATLTREFCEQSHAVHYAHGAMMNELAAMSGALEKLCTTDDDFANLAVAKQVQFLARDINAQLAPHFRHEEATVLRTVADVSHELALFAQQMRSEHDELARRFRGFCENLDALERVADVDGALAEVKREGHELVADLERHVTVEETQLAGFL